MGHTQVIIEIDGINNGRKLELSTNETVQDLMHILEFILNRPCYTMLLFHDGVQMDKRMRIEHYDLHHQDDPKIQVIPCQMYAFDDELSQCE